MTATEHARSSFRKNGGLMTTGEALAAGVHPRTLYALRDAGEVELLARGVYRLAGLAPLQEPDLVTVAKRVSQGVVCLISALAFHELTTQIPHEIHLALPRTARAPSLDYPPLRVFRCSEPAFSLGIETHRLDGVDVRIYSPEKTLADCFKFRTKIGLDVALESLKSYLKRRRPDLRKVMEFARVCRVERILRPYVEVLV